MYFWCSSPYQPINPLHSSVLELYATNSVIQTWRPLELLLSVATWLTSWGMYLAFCALPLLEPYYQQFQRWLEDCPVCLVSTLIGLYFLHKGLQAWSQHGAEQNRQNACQQWANRSHWSYNPAENGALYRHYGFLHGIPGHGVRFDASSPGAHTPCAIHVFEGQWRNYATTAFTYYSRRVIRYRSSRRRRSRVVHYHLALTVLHTRYHFPKLYIRPAHWSDILAKCLGFASNSKNVVFRSSAGETFRQRYRIDTDNPVFTQQCLHTRMMEYLLGQRDMKVEIDRDVLVLYQKGRLQPENIEANLERLHRIYQLIPKQWKR